MLLTVLREFGIPAVVVDDILGGPWVTAHLLCDEMGRPLRVESAGGALLWEPCALDPFARCLR
jgi:hypothetical protein